MSAVVPSAPRTPNDAPVITSEDVRRAAEHPASSSTKEKHETVESALERLDRSRQQLRAAMAPKPSVPIGDRLGRNMGAIASGVTERVKSLPGANVVMEALQTWWAKHPLHSFGVIAAEATRRVAHPVAQRNPWGLLLGAAAFGAVFSLARPWRWVLRPALLAGFIPVLAARVLKEIPTESLLRAYSAVSGKRGAAAAPASAAPRAAVATPRGAVTPAPSVSEPTRVTATLP